MLVFLIECSSRKLHMKVILIVVAVVRSKKDAEGNRAMSTYEIIQRLQGSIFCGVVWLVRQCVCSASMFKVASFCMHCQLLLSLNVVIV